MYGNWLGVIALKLSRHTRNFKASGIYPVLFWMVLCHPAAVGSSYPIVARGRGPETLHQGSLQAGPLHKPRCRGNVKPDDSNPHRTRRTVQVLFQRFVGIFPPVWHCHRSGDLGYDAACSPRTSCTCSKVCSPERVILPALTAQPSWSPSPPGTLCNCVLGSAITGKRAFCRWARSAMTEKSAGRFCGRIAPGAGRPGTPTARVSLCALDARRSPSQVARSSAGATVPPAHCSLLSRNLSGSRLAAGRKRRVEKKGTDYLLWEVESSTPITGIMHACRSP